MPAATTKADLLNITRKEYDKLIALLETVPDPLKDLKDEADTSVKDIVGHRAHWIQLFFGWYQDGQAGKDVYFPAKGYKWSELKAYNAQLRVSQATLNWSDACANLKKAHQDLCAFIEQKSQSELYSAPMKGANNNWTTGRWAEAAGPSHYRSAAKYIRQRLKAFSKA